MAYMSQEQKKEMAPAIKEVLKKHGFKATLAVRHHSTLICNISSGSLALQDGETHVGLSKHWWPSERFVNPEKWEAFHRDLVSVMMLGNHDNSDPMTDYFDVGWYIDINVGRWNKPYKHLEVSA